MNIMYERKFSIESVYEWLFDLDVDLYAYIQDAETLKQSEAAELLREVQDALNPIRAKLFSRLDEELEAWPC